MKTNQVNQLRRIIREEIEASQNSSLPKLKKLLQQAANIAEQLIEVNEDYDFEDLSMNLEQIVRELNEI
jgi:hypothetical protein